MTPPPMMLTIPHFSLHRYVFMVCTARNCSFPAHSRVGIPQSSVLYGWCVSHAHFRNEPINFPIRLHCYFSLDQNCTSEASCSHLLCFGSHCWAVSQCTSILLLGEAGQEACVSDHSCKWMFSPELISRKPPERWTGWRLGLQDQLLHCIDLFYWWRLTANADMASVEKP